MSACSRERHSLPLVGSCRIPPPLNSARHLFFSHTEVDDTRDKHSHFRRRIDSQAERYQKPAHLEISIQGKVRMVNSEFVEQPPSVIAEQIFVPVAKAPKIEFSRSSFIAFFRSVFQIMSARSASNHGTESSLDPHKKKDGHITRRLSNTLNLADLG